MGFFSRRRVPLPLRLGAAIPAFVAAGCFFAGVPGIALVFLLIAIVVAAVSIAVTEPEGDADDAHRPSIADQFNDSDWPPK